MAGRNGRGAAEKFEPAALEQRIYTVEAATKDLASDIHSLGQALGSQISALNTKLDERAKPQWSVMIALAATLLTFGGMIFSMGYLIVKNTTDHLEADVRRLDAANERQVSRAEFDTFRTNNNLAIREMRTGMVQKDQFEARWQQYRDSHKDLQDRVSAIAVRDQEAIDRVIQRLNSGFTIQDAIRGMTKSP